jgi:hypothetical protein
VDPSFISGPVAARAAIEISANARAVWAVIADIDAWPTWNPAVRQAALKDDLEVGRKFRYATTVGDLRCKLREVDAPRSLAWSSRLLTMAYRQAWSIEPSAQGCRAATAASWSGVGARLFKARLDARLPADLGAVVQLLKLEVEARAAETTDDAAQRAVEHE